VSKATVAVAGVGGAQHNLAAESLAGAKHLIQHVVTAIPNVVDWQELTVGTSAGTLASFCSGASIPANATHALFRVYPGGGDIHWTDDVGAGSPTDPTAAIGFPALAGEWGEWVALSQIKLIATAAGTKVGVSFRRYDT
jgi:hypothetical protein